MSKSRGNFLDPGDFVDTFGADGARYVVLREVPFDKDAEVSWDGFVRRYNADLANDFGNLVNRTVSMVNRYLAGERPAPGPESELSEGWSTALDACSHAIDDCLLHDALAALWLYVGVANKFVDASKPWELAKVWKAGDDAAGQTLRGVLGTLVEASRLLGLAVAPFLPATAPRILAQLGYAWPYAIDGNGGPPLLDELRWGAHAAERGTLTNAEPLFPRLETETEPD